MTMDTELDALEAADPNHRYQMFSKEGNDACEAIILEVLKELSWRGMRRIHLPSFVIRKMNEVEKVHGEVWDTEPRWQIIKEINTRVCIPEKWEPLNDEI